MGEGLSGELLKFIVLNVDSVELLEVLTLLYSQKEREWSVTDLDAIIRSNISSIEKRLEHLVGLGFANKINSEPTKFRYLPTNEDVAALGDKLLFAYQTRRVEVIELIYTKPMKEIFSFSNAFRLRGQKKDG